MRERKDKFYGPFQHRQQWRVVVVLADGSRGYRYFESEKEGTRYVREARLLTESRTVGSEVAAYLDSLRESGGHRPSTIKTIEYRLTAILRLREFDTPIGDITPSLARDLYERRTKQCKPDTHRGELVTVSQFCDRWLVTERKLLTKNPFADVKPRGSVSAGKTLLYTDEARTFLKASLADGTSDGLACAVVLIFGLRASELANLTCADLDAGGTLLRVRRGKTRNAIRAIEVPAEPAVLRSRLGALKAGREGTSQLFEGMTRHRLHHHVGRMCERAGVTKVCPHGLRGSAITIATATGSLHVAQALAGHRIGAPVTERHYIAPGTLETSYARAAGELLSVTDGVAVCDPATKVGNERATTPEIPFPIDVGEVREGLN